MPAARPYAEALFSLLRERGGAGAVIEEIEGVVRALQEAPHSRDVLVHPGAAPKAAEAVLGTLVQGRSPVVGNLLHLLFDKGRIGALQDIVLALRSRVDVAEGRVQARVQAARPLTEAQAVRLREALSQRLGSEVQLSFEERLELIGGIRVLFGDRVLDGSLSGQLASLRRRLSAQRG